MYLQNSEDWREKLWCSAAEVNKGFMWYSDELQCNSITHKHQHLQGWLRTITSLSATCWSSWTGQQMWCIIPVEQYQCRYWFPVLAAVNIPSWAHLASSRYEATNQGCDKLSRSLQKFKSFYTGLALCVPVALQQLTEETHCRFFF